MKKVMVILVVLILGILVLSTGTVYADSGNAGQVYIPPYTYMSPDSIYYVFSQRGEILNIGVDLRSIPLEHIAYYLPINSGCRCVIYEIGHKPIVIHALGEGGHVFPSPLPAEPCLY